MPHLLIYSDNFSNKGQLPPDGEDPTKAMLTKEILGDDDDDVVSRHLVTPPFPLVSWAGGVPGCNKSAIPTRE